MHESAPMIPSRSTEVVSRRRVWRWLALLPLLAVLGLADSSYLLWRHRAETSGFCPTGGCDLVNQGEYSEFGGIPVAAFGIGAYLLLLSLSIAAMTRPGRRALAMLAAVAGTGAIISAWLIYLQVAVIESICGWCVLSALTMTSLFVLSLSALVVTRPSQPSDAAVAEPLTPGPTGALRRAFRLPLMALGMVALVAALLGGLYRLGWEWSGIPTTLPAVHGPLMVSGFLGTLIGRERAVALGRWWPALGPLTTGAGAVILMIGGPGVAGPALMTLGSLMLVITFVYLIREQPALFTVTMGLGALVWLGGNTLWLSGWSIGSVIGWWAAFLILTIAGERLELSRFLPLARRHRLSFLAATTLFAAGLIPVETAFDVGTRLSGVGLTAMSVWLLRHDMARHAVRKTGLHRFVALSLLSGYVWLAAAGLLTLGLGGMAAGLHHDATLHAMHQHNGPDGYDATLHAIFVGFVFSMIMGHAPIIFPSILGIALPFRPVFYSHLILLHLSLALRVAGDITAWWPGRLWGGSLNVAAILLFLVNMAASALSGKRSARLENAGGRSG
ncbi:MAG: vitamin K epoxide reductase family protein [candidate division NC10 bacterium]|nr:vitamin K epoxide reductase family protein [candidate division NC10 bacterium]